MPRIYLCAPSPFLLTVSSSKKAFPMPNDSRRRNLGLAVYLAL